MTVLWMFIDLDPVLVKFPTEYAWLDAKHKMRSFESLAKTEYEWLLSSAGTL